MASIGLVINMYGGAGDREADEEPWIDVPTPASWFGLDTLSRVVRLGCMLVIDQYIDTQP